MTGKANGRNTGEERRNSSGHDAGQTVPGMQQEGRLLAIPNNRTVHLVGISDATLIELANCH